MGGKFIILKAKLCRKSGERILPLKLMLSNAFHTLIQLAQWTDADFAARRHKGLVAKAINRSILSKQFLKKRKSVRVNKIFFDHLLKIQHVHRKFVYLLFTCLLRDFSKKVKTINFRTSELANFKGKMFP